MSEKEAAKRILCPECRGSGLDKNLRHRFTTGGHNDRTCPRCNGECYVDAGDENLKEESK